MNRSPQSVFSLSAAVVAAACAFWALSNGQAASPNGGPANPAIDMPGYLAVSLEAAKHRESHRLTEDEFIKMSQEEGVIVLDARSKEKYDQLHIKGAINLSFPDIAVETLQKTLPDKSARILIYCNNNFKGARKYVADDGPFITKSARASLNLSTYIALYSYGYRNVYELGPQLDPDASKLTFEPAVAKK